MTAIAYRDGIMAADSLANADGAVHGYTIKIVRAPSGALAGVAGEAGATARFRRLFAAGEFAIDEEIDADEDFGALIVEPEGTVYRRGLKHFFSIVAPFHVLGSAEEILIGAMSMGATADEAVRIAIKYHGQCGGDVQVERLL